MGRAAPRAVYPAPAAVAGRRRGGGVGTARQRRPRFQGGELPRVPGPARRALHLQRAVGPLLRRLRRDRHGCVPPHRVVGLGAVAVARSAFRIAADPLPGQRAPGRRRVGVVGRAAALPQAQDRALRRRYRLGAHADGPGGLRRRPLGVRSREQRLAHHAVAERGAAAQLLVLLHRRPVGRRAAPRDRRRPHHGRKRLPARRLDLARHPARTRPRPGAGCPRTSCAPWPAGTPRRCSATRSRSGTTGARRWGDCPGHPAAPALWPDHRRGRPRRRTGDDVGRTARRLPAQHRTRRARLRARDGRRDRSPRRAARHPGPPGLEVRRPRGLPAPRRGPTRRGGSRGALGRHGGRGHRPGGVVPDHRALLQRRARPVRGRTPRHRLQRLAGGVLRHEPAAALRCRRAPAPGPAGRGTRAATGRRRARLRGRLRSAQPVPRALAVPPGVRRPVGRRRGARRADRHPRGQLGDRPDAGRRPALQSPRVARPVASVRADARLRAAHRLRRPRTPPRPALRLPGILGWVGSVLARAPK